ncbi:MAG: hypothetical protein JO337_02630, partial [Acidimicrobiales bacterium]|nr:hypothetical protein [Acidimicrobiales bacterium]
MWDTFASGASEVLGVLDREPVHFVDLDRGWSDIPPLYPAVVVGVGSGQRATGGADVALTTMIDPPAPWVSVADLDTARHDLDAAVRASPFAAVTLVQLLRLGAGRLVEEGLALESLSYSVLQGGAEFAQWKAGHSYPSLGEDLQPPVLAEVAGTELSITLNRPDVHNAYNRAMRDALCEALAVAATDTTLSVNIKGNGPSFCSGGDL